MKRRQFIAWGCAHCALLGAVSVRAQVAEQRDWAMPPRFARPDAASDEGGLWATMAREEARLRRSPFLMRDEALREYLQGIACKLGAGHCPDIRVYPVRTPWFNASMAPNGMMQVWSGLLLRVENEAQLAAVIGHEIAHYLQRHSIDRLRDAKSKSAFGTFLAAFGLVGAIGQLATIASMYAYSREHEREADRIGVVLMNQAGYDAREAAKVWDNLLQEVSAGAGGDPSRRSPMFASHPASDERRDALLQWAGDAGGDTGEARFAEQLAPLQFDLLDDELKRGQYDEALVLLDRMVARQPQRAELKYFRGETRRLRAQDGDLDQALADFEAAVRAGGEPAQTHRSMGFILRGRNQSEPARAAFARYLEKAPAAPDAGLIQSYLAETKS
ncbi:MAG: hypothetical protein BroJett031_16450 [Betaproteobacteria bacterium]|nr:MAG: hypothetical protein BroJett031_16450 [Betaproteobacteria bacterium]